MISFIITESHLRALSPGARGELLDLIAEETKSLHLRLSEIEWNPERTRSYPLSLDEAQTLLSNTPAPMLAALQVFCDNFDGKVGRASLEELMAVTGCSDHEALNQSFTELLQSLQQITGNREAWLLNWHADDWEWSDEEERYVKGSYFISETAIVALREAIGG